MIFVCLGPSIERAVGQFTAALAPMTLGGDPDIKPLEGITRTDYLQNYLTNIYIDMCKYIQK
jgi:hypothetical protein